MDEGIGQGASRVLESARRKVIPRRAFVHLTLRRRRPGSNAHKKRRPDERFSSWRDFHYGSGTPGDNWRDINASGFRIVTPRTPALTSAHAPEQMILASAQRVSGGGKKK
jgi:hypothetical protein